MSAGLEVVTPDRHLVINEKYENICYNKKIKFSQLSYQGQVKGYIEPWSSFKIGMLDNYKLNLTTDDFLWGIGPIEKINHNIMPVISKVKNVVEFNVVPGTNLDGVEIYLFSRKKQSMNNYGLQVFNEKGEIVFDSGVKYLRVNDYGWNCTPKYSSKEIIISSKAITTGQDGCWFYEFKNGNIRYYLNYYSGLTASAARRIAEEFILCDVSDY